MRISRRQALGATAALWASRFASAQEGSRAKRLALLFRGSDDSAARFRASTGKALATLGWIEGRSLRIDVAYAGPDMAEEDAAARKLVAAKPDVIFTNAWFLARALKQATSSIPIVATMGDPVGAGLVKNLRQPGGNLTGLSFAYDLVAHKQIELLRQLLPRLRVVHTINPEPDADPFGAVAAANLSPRSWPSIAAYDRALGGMARDGTAALVVPTWLPPARHPREGKKEIIAVALRHRMPTMGWGEYFARAGGLACFTLDYHGDVDARVASLIDAMLKGEDPGTTPFELPTKTVFGVNHATADAIGVKIPPSWLVRADFIVER